MVQVAIMGHGVVGSGVAEILLTHKENLAKKAKDEIYVKHILDLREFPDSPFADRFTKDFNDIINDDEVKVVVEVMGGLHPAYEFVKNCLEKGKSVVTSNKELVAAKGAELLSVARDNNVNFLFEASVGGGIPIIRPISQCLAANDVSEIAGILNGTTNFILTKMIKEQMRFEDALALAQKLGYAEKDPTADVEGYDAVRKICILASLTFGKHVYPDNIYTEGITKITLQDVEYASSWGGVIKLIGSVKMLESNQIDIFVAPMLISRESQLAGVDDVFNGIMVRGDATGDVVFYGKGAGKLPTASAVVADVIDCIKHINARKYLYWSDSEDGYVINYKDSITAMYIRAEVQSSDEGFDKAREIFGNIKPLSRNNAPQNEIAFVTEEKTFGELLDGIDKFSSNGIQVLSRIRIGDL
ncbi:MAG: homoserine dehydrogenase [Acutalibacteraceae bacterium]